MNKSFKMNQDVQILILSYLEPEDIITLHNANHFLIINDLKTYFPFTIYCHKIVSNETIQWFEQHTIPLKLHTTHTVDEDGSQYWYQNGQLHRDHDLPAIVTKNGDQIWYQLGKKHRDHDLPAIMNADGTHHWLLYDNYYTRKNNLPSICNPILINDHFIETVQLYYRNGRFYM